MKRLLLSAFAIALCVGAAGAITTDNNSVYQIGSADDLIEFASIVNGTHTTISQNTGACAVVKADIDLSNTTYTPIANADETVYTGTFDGGGHTITLNIISTSNFQGLFGHVASCTIENVTVAGSVTGRNFVGGIVGMIRSKTTDQKTTISNCHNKATIKGVADSDATNGRCVGGIVGIINNETAESGSDKLKGGETTISGCSNSGAVSSNSTSGKTGGIVGYSGAQLTVTRCTNSGAIDGGTKNAGGIVGMFYSEFSAASLCIEYCANTGCVTSNGGVIASLLAGGSMSGSLSVTGCYNSYTGLNAISNSVSSKTLTRCYDIDGTSGFTSFISDEERNGTLCYNLNGGAASTGCWYQNIATDSYPVLTAEDNEANVVNKATKTKFGETSGTDVYFNSTGGGCSINTDATAFYVLSDIDATDKAKENLKSGTETGLTNVLYSTDNTNYYCANAVLKDKTAYSVDKAYTAAHFTYERTGLSADGIYTFILPAEIGADKVNGKVYKLTSYENGTLKFTEVTGTLSANTPYLVQSSSTTLLTGMLTSVSVSAMAANDVAAGSATHVGSYSKQTSSDAASTGYTYYGYTGGKFVKATGTWTLNPFRTMIKILSGGNGAKSLGLQLGDEVTGIVSPTLESAPVDVYTTSGVKVRSQTDSATALQGLPTGIYLIGGKKVVKN